jgi:Zn-dependent protease with chaperone function
LKIPPRTGSGRGAPSAGVGGPGAWRSLVNLARRLRRRIGKPAHLDAASTRGFGFPEFLDELRVPGLDGRYFTWEEYRDRLEVRLGIEVRVRFLEDPLVRMALLGNDLGRVYRDEKTGDALVLVSGELDEFEAAEVIYHELGHVAGGHPLPRGKQLSLKSRG